MRYCIYKYKTMTRCNINKLEYKQSNEINIHFDSFCCNINKIEYKYFHLIILLSVFINFIFFIDK